MPRMEFHKPIRLVKEVYSVPFQPCSITIGTNSRQPIFRNHEFANAAATVVREYATKHSVKFYAFCFMPDHIHLLTEATLSKSIIDIVKEMKGIWTKCAWQHGMNGLIFQKSFFDHFLRKDEDILTVVHYILNNPVRAGLVERWEAYPHLGSTVYDVGEL